MATNPIPPGSMNLSVNIPESLMASIEDLTRRSRLRKKSEYVRRLLEFARDNNWVFRMPDVPVADVRREPVVIPIAAEIERELDAQISAVAEHPENYSASERQMIAKRVVARILTDPHFRHGITKPSTRPAKS